MSEQMVEMSMLGCPSVCPRVSMCAANRNLMRRGTIQALNAAGTAHCAVVRQAQQVRTSTAH